MSAFNFTTAQRYELDWQKNFIKAEFQGEYDRWQERKKALFSGWAMDTFFTIPDPGFQEHIQDKIALEVGCGSSPMLKECWNIHKRVAIDPLAEAYNEFELQQFGKTFFDGIAIYPIPAETVIDNLIGEVDGFILFRNALDHTEDPMAVMQVLADYAKKDCYLLFWTDIWHNYEVDEGHKNLTRNPKAMSSFLSGLGWDKVCDVPPQRNDNLHIEFGGVYRKR